MLFCIYNLDFFIIHTNPLFVHQKQSTSDFHASFIIFALRAMHIEREREKEREREGGDGLRRTGRFSLDFLFLKIDLRDV